jgi:hypothetical protein
MPKIKRLRHGIGAKISVYKKFLHPRALVAAKHPNAGKAVVLHGLVAVRHREICCLEKETVVHSHAPQ